MKEQERDYNGDVVRQCAECEWCKDLEASNGEFYYFCMNAESGAFLEETGLLGNCTVSAEDEE